MPILKFFRYGVKRMANDALICIPLLASRVEFIQKVLLPSLKISLESYTGPVQFHVSLVAQGIPLGDLSPFSSLPHWSLQTFTDPFTPCPYGDKLVSYRIRQQAALTGYSYYLLADDDFRFYEKSMTPSGAKGSQFEVSSIARYAEVVEAMERNPNVGSVMCASFFGGGLRKPNPFYPLEKPETMWTNKGLIVRNLGRLYPERYEAIFPKGVMDWTRAVFSPDLILGCLPLLEGLQVAKSFNHPAQHYTSFVGSVANVPLDYRPLLPDKSSVLYPNFQITDTWRQADDWSLGKQLFGENLSFNQEITGRPHESPGASKVLTCADVFKPRSSFFAAAFKASPAKPTKSPSAGATTRRKQPAKKRLFGM